MVRKAWCELSSDYYALKLGLIKQYNTQVWFDI